MLSLRFDDCVVRFLEWCRVNRRPKTTASYKYQLERFGRWFGNGELGELSPARVTSFSRKFHVVQAVQRLCSWCHKEERSLTVNPLAGMRKPAMGTRKRTLDRGQVVKLMRAADACFRRFLIFAAESMARPQELRALKWGDMAAAAELRGDTAAAAPAPSHFELFGAKGFERRGDGATVRVIPISPRLVRLLGRLAAGGAGAGEFILKDSRGRPWTANAVRCRMRRLRERAGLLADRRGEKIVAYTFRHTGATAAAAAGLRDWLLAEALGHASPRTTDRYVHLRPADVVDGMQRVWEAKTGRRPENGLPRSSRNRPDDLG